MNARAPNQPGRSVTTIGVIGLGYVGLPLAHALHAAGKDGSIRVLGVDTDPSKPRSLKPGAGKKPTPYLKHLGAALYDELATSVRFDATTDHARLRECDAILVCVPTPLDTNHRPDLSFVVKAAEQVAGALKPGQVIVLESTTYPGTTRHEFLAPLRRAHPHLEPGRDYFVAFSPEREDPGNQHYTTAQIPKVVGGLDAESTRRAADLYRRAFATVVEVESAEVAESAKLLENIFRAVNIALVNELKVVLEAMGVDIWKVIAAASTKPFGFMPFYPGPGLGGHCIPIDPFYMSHKARQMGVPSEFIELAGRINTAMPGRVVARTLEALASRAVEPTRARVLVLGLAYKPDIDDVRESPALEIIELLRERVPGMHVDYHDPHVPATHAMRHYDLGMKSVPLTVQAVAGYDAVVVVTAHTTIDWAMVARHARLVVDTRNAMAGFAGEMGARLVKA